MKIKTIYTLFLLCPALFAQAQLYAPEIKVENIADGKVGIGTNAPNTKLHVKDDNEVVLKAESSAASSQILLENTSQGGNQWRLISTGDGSSIGGGKLSFYNPLFSGAHNFVVDNNGKVGIGQTSATATLSLKGIANNRVLDAYNNSNDALLFQFNTSGGYPNLTLYDLDGTTKLVRLNANGDSFFNGGNVGIGTASPNSSYKLEVAGTVRATTFSASNPPWADFVFEEGYQLPKLEEMTRFSWFSTSLVRKSVFTITSPGDRFSVFNSKVVVIK